MPLLALIRTGQLTGPPPKIEVSLSDKRENNEPGGGYRVIAGGKVLQQQATRCRLSQERVRSRQSHVLEPNCIELTASSARMGIGDNEVILVSPEINKSNGPAREGRRKKGSHVGLSECRQLVLHIDFTDSGRWLN